LRYFEHTLAHTGFPPAWHINPFTNQQAQPIANWSHISDFGYGDMKVIWEASRFGFVYALVRSYWRTGEAWCAELFLAARRDWRVRILLSKDRIGSVDRRRVYVSWPVLWALRIPGQSSNHGDARCHAGADDCGVGQRIAANLDYALSQRNNHGISEGMGLWTIGTLFPELHSAAQWRQLGYQVSKRKAESSSMTTGPLLNTPSITSA